jgi:IS4 transposase
MYDLCNRLYVDAVIQPNDSKNEGKALADMVDRSRISGKPIVTADRGYESYNNFAHIEQKGWHYLIRVKDLGSSGIVSGLALPQDGEFDLTIHRILTRKQTNEVKENPDVYRYLNNKTTFDFLDAENAFYPIAFRVVRFKIADDSYETVITNLPQSDFPPPELKTLYNMRWGLETSFRELKYAVGLVNFHSKKREYIEQEVFARIIMYNFAEMITSHVVISQSDTKHAYQVNFTVAIHICKRLLRLMDNGLPLEVEALIRKNILPVRPDRAFPRNMRSKKTVSFIYRVA